MRTVTTIVAGIVSLGLASGCLVRTHNHRGPPSSARRGDCGPAHHWDGYRCVHNGHGRGNGNGNGNGPIRDHRR
jgi:hypothetical protein